MCGLSVRRITRPENLWAERGQQNLYCTFPVSAHGSLRPNLPILLRKQTNPPRAAASRAFVATYQFLHRGECRARPANTLANKKREVGASCQTDFLREWNPAKPVLMDCLRDRGGIFGSLRRRNKVPPGDTATRRAQTKLRRHLKEIPYLGILEK